MNSILCHYETLMTCRPSRTSLLLTSYIMIGFIW